MRADAALADALANIPLPALGAAAAVVVGALGTVAWAVSQQNPASSTAEGAAEEPAAPVIPRENAVLVFGASGRMGRQLVAEVRCCQTGFAVCKAAAQKIRAAFRARCKTCQAWSVSLPTADLPSSPPTLPLASRLAQALPPSMLLNHATS